MVQGRRAALAALALIWAACASSAERGGLPDAGAADAAMIAADSAPDTMGAPDLAAEVAPADGGAASTRLAVEQAELDFGVFYLGCPRASAVARVTNRAASLTDPLLVTIDKPFRIGTDGCSVDNVTM